MCVMYVCVVCSCVPLRRRCCVRGLAGPRPLAWLRGGCLRRGFGPRGRLCAFWPGFRRAGRPPLAGGFVSFWLAFCVLLALAFSRPAWYTCLVGWWLGGRGLPASCRGRSLGVLPWLVLLLRLPFLRLLWRLLRLSRLVPALPCSARVLFRLLALFAPSSPRFPLASSSSPVVLAASMPLLLLRLLRVAWPFPSSPRRGRPSAVLPVRSVRGRFSPRALAPWCFCAAARPAPWPRWPPPVPCACRSSSSLAVVRLRLGFRPPRCGVSPALFGRDPRASLAPLVGVFL